ncbi:hypothetical protein [Clostridium senegalense]|uniref:hypothetical protein n=1 Tax=Clostridium senegalense TaxID=1465809 RepID=UPI00028800B1|nr:hypothetical protein [Clostridium senegalense]
MIKNKIDYPIVLTTKHVVEIMECSEPAARTYIKTVNKILEQEGKINPQLVVNNARVSRDKFFKEYGI